MKKDLSLFTQTLTNATKIQQETSLSNVVFMPGTIEYQNFVSNTENRAMFSDCMFEGLKFIHTHIDGIRMTFTGYDCGVGTSGIEILHSSFLSVHERPVIELLTASKLKRLVIRNSIIDGFSIFDQQEDIEIILDHCLFRKPFFLELTKFVKCVVNVKKCIGVEENSFSIVDTSSTRNTKVFTDKFSSRMFHNPSFDYRVRG